MSLAASRAPTLTEPPTPQAAENTLRGAALTIAAYFFMTFNDLLIKILVEDIPTGQILFIRSMIGCLFLLLMWRLMNNPMRLRPQSVSSVLLCAGLIVPALYLFPFSLNFLPLTTALILTFCSPIIVVLLAPFVTGERPGKRRIAAVLIGFIGAILVIGPAMSGWQVAYLLPIICAIFMALRDLVTCRIAKAENPVSITLAAFIMVAVSAPVTAWTGPSWIVMDGLQVLLLVVASCCLALGQTISILAFRFASAPIISGLKFTAILWSVLFSLVLFGILPTALELVGAILIAISSLAIVIIRDQRLSAAQLPILMRKAPDQHGRTDQ